MFTKGPKWAEHPDVSWARGPATHLGAKHQAASFSEHNNLPSSAILAVEVVACPVDPGGGQLDAQQLKEIWQAKHVKLMQQEQLVLQAKYAQPEG